jgi:hypothetical protein
MRFPFAVKRLRRFEPSLGKSLYLTVNRRLGAPDSDSGNWDT